MVWTVESNPADDNTTCDKMKTPTVPTRYDVPGPVPALTISDIYLAGYSRGWNCASWQDIPDIGIKLPSHVDYQVGKISDASDQADALQMLASEAESNGRDFSPFDFTAHELNEREDSEDAWEAFDSGIADGISANVASRIQPEPDIPVGNLTDDENTDLEIQS